MGCDDSYPSRYIVIPSHILSGPIQDALFSLRLQRSLRMTFSQSFTCLRGYPMRAALTLYFQRVAQAKLPEAYAGVNIVLQTSWVVYE
jgi:hypothetical protein